MSLLEPHRDQVTWGRAGGGATSEALPFQPHCLNCKPSRFGALPCASSSSTTAAPTREIALYGGGQFELGVGQRADPVAGSPLPSGTAGTTSLPGEFNEIRSHGRGCRRARSRSSARRGVSPRPRSRVTAALPPADEQGPVPANNRASPRPTAASSTSPAAASGTRQSRHHQTVRARGKPPRNRRAGTKSCSFVTPELRCLAPQNGTSTPPLSTRPRGRVPALGVAPYCSASKDISGGPRGAGGRSRRSGRRRWRGAPCSPPVTHGMASRELADGLADEQRQAEPEGDAQRRADKGGHDALVPDHPAGLATRHAQLRAACPARASARRRRARACSRSRTG